MHQGLTAQLEVEGKELFRTDAGWKWSAGTRFRQCGATWADLSDSLVDARRGWRLDNSRLQRRGMETRRGHKQQRLGQTDGAAHGPASRKTGRADVLQRSQAAGRAEGGRKVEFDTGRIVQAYPVVELDAEAGAKRIRIEPHLGDLARTAGVVVTEFGPIFGFVAQGRRFLADFQVTAAESAETTLALPSRAGRDSILLDGKMQSGES